ncbi:ribosome silencing factor [Acetanaerobacterium elongatum]|uniref:Ribosomal silencing factor RsfS n=1 Tax=Acetanaerobacterium elongatum TaxID=258515 RepID=A0A1H0DML1_9FIRM|nr:ribosome silencing factor [Acetanaerobacterium elongatum]SDN71276.1 ribosome-associated protein [Acetanaerobacterium elongatum]
MTSLETAKKIVSILDTKKAEDIRVIRVRDLTVLTDYFVLASGTSSTHVKSLTDEVEFQLKQLGTAPAAVEGYGSAQWVALDFGTVIVHVFYPEARRFYDLERLWADGEKIDIDSLPKQD